MFTLLEVAVFKDMPIVGKKHFPYTVAGKKKAKQFAKKTGKKVMDKEVSKKKE